MRLPRPALLALVAILLAPASAGAQDRFRLGLSFGGLGFMGVVAEQSWGDRSAELLVSTFTFRDVSLSLVGKQYFGASYLKPAVGAGLWYMLGASEDGPGSALLLRFPLGGDWRVSGPHYVTFEVNVARGLLVWRPDPEDDHPMTTRIIPLPSFSYRLDPGGF
jgi:hypothetical protein